MTPLIASAMQQLVADRHAALHVGRRRSRLRRVRRERRLGWFDRVVPAGAVPKPVAPVRPASTEFRAPHDQAA